MGHYDEAYEEMAEDTRRLKRKEAAQEADIRARSKLHSSDMIANKRIDNERQAAGNLRDAADKDFLEHFERVMTTPEGRAIFERLLGVR